jgi:hypothetical protein
MRGTFLAGALRAPPYSYVGGGTTDRPTGPCARTSSSDDLPVRAAGENDGEKSSQNADDLLHFVYNLLVKDSTPPLIRQVATLRFASPSYLLQGVRRRDAFARASSRRRYHNARAPDGVVAEL